MKHRDDICEQCGKPGWRADLQPLHSPLLKRQVWLCRACRERPARQAAGGRRGGRMSRVKNATNGRATK